MTNEQSIKALAESHIRRGPGKVVGGWKSDAVQAAQRIKTNFELLNNLPYTRARQERLTIPRKAVTVICGKTGGGKTTTMLNLSVQFAMNGLKGLFITLEEPEFSLGAKTMAIYDCIKRNADEAQTTNQFKFALKTGQIDKWDLYEEYKLGILENLTIVDANKHATAKDIAAPSVLYDPRCLDEFAKHIPDLDFIMVDYVQLMDAGKKHSNPYMNIKDIMQALRYMTGHHKAAIVLGAQVNREASRLHMSEWQPEHLREAADIEQNANMIIAAGRCEMCSGDVGYAIKILKNRDANPHLDAVFNVEWERSYVHPDPMEMLEAGAEEG